MISALNLSLPALLGERGSLEYFRQVILPELEKLSRAGNLSPQELRKVRELVHKQGVSVLAPQMRCLDDLTLNTVGDGYLVEAVLPVANGVVVKNVIKGAASREGFRNGVRNQRRVAHFLKDTEFVSAVPPVVYVNARRRVLVTPFVEGVLLKEKLDAVPAAEKKILLEGVISDYAHMFTVLNKEKLWLNLPGNFEPMTDFFVAKYRGISPKVVGVFDDVLGRSLLEAMWSVIHGDLHPKNIIADGRPVYIDWEHAVSNGFPEFDIGKLLSKASIDSVVEDQLVHAAAEMINPQNPGAFRLRYRQNKAAQGFFSARRYLDRAARVSDEKIRDHLEGLALVYFNQAVRSLDNPDSGLVTGIHATAPTKLYVVDDHTLESLEHSFSPSALMSQEQLRPTTPLTDMITVNVDEELAGIGREIRVARRMQRLKRAGVVAALAVAGVGIKFGLDYRVESQVGDVERRHYEERSLELAQDLYKRIFRSGYHELAEKVTAGEVFSRFTESSPVIDAVAQKYGLDAALMRRMIRVNRCYADIDVVTINPRLKDILIFDPLITTWREGKKSVLDPRQNLEEGAARFSLLMKKHNSDVEAALTDFYDPTLGSNFDASARDRLKPDVARLVYNAQRGVSWASDGGIGSVYLVEPPRNAPSPNVR